MKMATIGTAIRLNDMMSDPIRNITNAMNMMLSAWDSLDTATSGGLDINGVESIRSELNQATRALDAMGDEQQEFNRYVQNGSNAMDGLTDKIIGAVGAFAGMQGIQKLVNLSDTFTQTTARLNMINDGAQTTDELFDKIAASADRARASISTTADTVAKLSLNAGDAFGSNDETILFAENLNKLFAIAGTEQASIASASLQLTQALGSGVLRGEEFNAVFEAAPNIMQTVADYMDVPIGKLRQMAQDGQITADVVKNALLSATGEINEQFESMPMTWGQVWTGVMNELYYASLPLLEFINLLAQNWSVIEPIVLGIATAVGLYTAALLIHNGVTAASALAKSIHAASLMMESGATFAATAAQHGFNAALLACPITWIIIGIIAVIAAVYAIVAAINKAQGTAISATGVIMGAFAVAGAFLMNLVIGVLNAIIQFAWSHFVEPFIGIIEWILNVCNGGFNSFGDAVANLIGQIIGWFLSLGTVITKIIDAIFGTDWTSGLNSLRDEVVAWGKNEDAITLERNAPEITKRFEYSSAWDSGYEFGAGVEDSIGNFFTGGFDGLADKYGAENYAPLLDSVPTFDEIATNTGDTADALEITSEHLKYLRDYAEQEVVNKFTTAEIHVEMGGIQNNVNQNTDLDGVIDYMVTGVQEAMERVAEGVHD
jgi:tape measure domain-containing protein